MENFDTSVDCAKRLDENDTLRRYKEEFLFPKTKYGKQALYFSGNSLGLQPKKTRSFIERELDDWAANGVASHFRVEDGWFSYHELFAEPMARIVGAKPIEVVMMNTLTVNLHLMMVSFYRPNKTKFKIMMEDGAFPSDQFVVKSQLDFHSRYAGFNPDEALVLLKPRDGENLLRTEDIVSEIEKQGDSLALVLLGDVNFRTGQAFEVSAIVKAARSQNANIGLDLAHGAGNLLLKLHDWDVDFAAWCSYKYLNSGPGSLAGCFVHEKHANDKTLPRFAGWWGHNKKTRFEMNLASVFDSIPGAEGWQLSNPPILPLAALRGSMELFDRAGIENLTDKSKVITSYLEFLLDDLGQYEIITPRDSNQRGSQITFRVKGSAEPLFKKLLDQGVYCDLRGKDILRVAPVPLYCSFSDIYEFYKILKEV